MDDPVSMRRVERRSHLRSDAQNFVHGQGTTPEPAVEGLAVEELHDEIRVLALDADVVERADVGMVEAGDGLRLDLKAGAGLGGGSERGRDELERYVTTEPRVARAIDLSHAARAEPTDDLVRAKPRTGCQRHWAAL